MYHVSTFIPTKGSLSPPNHLAKFRQVRADGLHRAAARGDAEVGHDDARPSLVPKNHGLNETWRYFQ